MVSFEHFISIVIDEITEYLEGINAEHIVDLELWRIYYDELIDILNTRDENIEDISANFVEKLIKRYVELSPGKKHALRNIIFDACYHFCNIYTSQEYEQEILDEYNEYLHTFN